MRRLDRYILREFIRTYLIIFFSFAVVFIVIDVVDNLPRLLRAGATVDLATTYYLLRLPYLAVLTSPVTVLLTGLFMMNGLSKHNESVAIRAAGVSIKRAMLPLFVLGLFISIIVAAFGEYVLPAAESYRSYVYNVKIKGEQPDDQLLKSRIHYRGDEDDFYYFGFFDGYKNNLRIIDLARIDFENNEISQHISANSASWEDDKWVLKDCEVREFSSKEQRNFVHYPQTDIEFLNVEPNDFVRITKKTLALNFMELKEYIGRLQKLGEDASREIVDLHMKISFPLTNLIVIFFFIPIATSNVRSKGRGWVFMLGLVVCFAYLFIVKFSQSFGYNGVIPPIWAAWAPNILFTIIGVVFLQKSEI
ncbi:MAG: LPS export ABC transporter permease LptG [Candidatus Cloacimonetes bacterium]|jgi:lipopolysaccharide export system permease protein|nr:LPS export ABC transporter permease LptG [Candidatus Cloacimonadota bacterium]NLO43822.1 LPS export ABC transporter permease LptG [Candidatus Cloacimonadota bacterium]